MRRLNQPFFFIIFAISLVIALCSCTTLSSRPLCPSVTDSSFWFRMDPELLGSRTDLASYPFTYNPNYDSLFAKCTLLLASLDQSVAPQLYAPQSIHYEIVATLAMLSSLDPIESFAGANIRRVPAARFQLEQFRSALQKYQAEYAAIAPIDATF